MNYRTLQEYKEEIYEKLDDNKKLEWIYQMSKQLCEIFEYATEICEEYLEDDCVCEYCDGKFNSCRKILQILGENVEKYE